MKHGVHHIAGDGSLFFMCSKDGTLTAFKDDTKFLQARCRRTLTAAPIAVARNDYAFLSDTGTLLLSRHGQRADIRTPLTGEYELALSNTGVVALVDYERAGQPWFVRPKSAELQLGPQHASQPMSVAVADNLVAWGYADGVVSVLDTITSNTWTFKGHTEGVFYLAFEKGGHRIISGASHQIRIWDLNPSKAFRIKQLHCNVGNIETSPDRMLAALDCDDGSVWVWTLSSGDIIQLHKHDEVAFGVQWLNGLACSGSWDGRIICSTPDGRVSKKFEPHAGRIVWLAASAAHDFLIIATADGQIWKLDDKLHLIYSQNAIPYRVAISPDTTRVASCGLDGSLVIYDLSNSNVQYRTLAHRGAIHSLAWQNDELWTSGVDGNLRSWKIQGNSVTAADKISESAAFRLTKVFKHGWAANVGEGILMVSSDALARPLRLELDRHIETIDVSPDSRYIAVGILGEIVILDTKTRTLASVDIDSGPRTYIAFVSGDTLAVSTKSALSVVSLSDLDYFALGY